MNRRDTNDCPECARQHGLHYSGPCEHGELVSRRNPPAPIVPSIYTPTQLKREARSSVKGLGKLIRYEVAIHKSGHVQLRCYFVRHFNPLRPIAQQAIECTTAAL